MIVDQNLETESGWGYHLGGNIGGVPPQQFGIDQGFPAIGARFYVQGTTVPGKYADGEAYLERPLCPNTGNLSLSFYLMLDENVAANAQALEFDVKVTDQNGYTYNFSFQWLNAAGGALQISNVAGDWVSIGVAIPTLSPLVRHQFVMNYEFNETTQTYSFGSIEIDGRVYEIPASLQNLAAEKSGWQPGATVQVQLDLNEKAGQFSHYVSALQLAWS